MVRAFVKGGGGWVAEVNLASEFENSSFWNHKIRVNLKTSEFGRKLVHKIRVNSGVSEFEQFGHKFRVNFTKF